MPDDVRAKIDIETSTAESNVDGLEGKVRDLDKAVDTADGQKIDIPVDAPGAQQTAARLDDVDQAARRAGSGAQVGTQHISDMTGPFGDASGAASTFGQSVEGVAGLVEGMAGKLGLSEQATGKLTAGLGVAAVAVAAGAAAWSLYNASQDAAKKGAEEVATALQSVQEKLAAGDAAAAAEAFLSGMSAKIEAFRSKFLPGASTVDIAGAMIGDPQSLANVDAAIGQLDSSTRFLAEGGLKILKGSWDASKQAADDQIALKSKITDLFGSTAAAADTATAAIDKNTAAIQNNAAAVAAATNPTGGLPYETASGSAANPNQKLGVLTTIINNFPPANTPVAVEQAAYRYAQINGPR